MQRIHKTVAFRAIETPYVIAERLRLRHDDRHAYRGLQLRGRVRFAPRDLQESTGGHRREEISRCDNAVRAYEGDSHFIATDRHGEAVPEGPRLLHDGLRDVRHDVAETVVGDHDSFEAALPFLWHAEVQVNEVLDDRPDILDLRAGQEVRGGGGEQISTVERVREFRSPQFAVRDLTDILQSKSPALGTYQSVVRSVQEATT